jgi:diadenosine tetraphosphate (Ap4A) HIT family hydrolase
MCKFCNVKKDILWENKRVFVMHGRPHHKGNLKVVLKKHYEKITDLSEKMAKNFFYDIIKVARIVKEVLKPDKLNYSIWGNWTPHLHCHITPRFKGDEDYGNPPYIPGKKEKYEKKELSKSEKELLIKKLKTLK